MVTPTHGGGLGQTPIHAVDTADIAGVPCFIYRAHRDPAPSLLWMHGGGWVLGGQATHDEIYRALAAGTGCHVVAPEYSLAPERPFPAAVDECIAVLDTLTSGRVPDGLTAGPLAIGADSAGANLSFVAAMSSPHPSHRALAAVYPVTDARCSTASYDLDHSESYLQPRWMRWFVTHYLCEGGDASDWRISPVLAPDENLRRLPPTYILVASHDPLRDEGVEMAGRLLALGHDTELDQAVGLPHGFLGLRRGLRPTASRRPLRIHSASNQKLTIVPRIICSLAPGRLTCPVMRLKHLVVVGVVALTAPALIGAGGDSAPPSDSTAPGDSTGTTDVCQGQDGAGLKVGFANLGGGIPFTQQVEDGIKDVAEQCNLELVIADNNFDGQTAIDNARNFVTQEVDGVIEFQVDAGLEGAVCEALGDLPVIAIDIAHPSCAVFMGADNARAGELGGEGLGNYAAENWDCNIDLIVSLESFGVGDVNIARANGLIRGITEVCPDVAVGDFEEWAPEVGGDSVVVRCDCGGTTDSAFPLFRDILTANPDAQHIAVVSLNDDMGLAAMAAAEEAGRLEQLAIASQGADATVHDAIRDTPGYVGSTAYFPEDYGTYLVPAIIRMINGDEVDDPILVEHVFLDATNVDEYYPA